MSGCVRLTCPVFIGTCFLLFVAVFLVRDFCRHRIFVWQVSYEALTMTVLFESGFFKLYITDHVAFFDAVSMNVTLVVTTNLVKRDELMLSEYFITCCAML